MEYKRYWTSGHANAGSLGTGNNRKSLNDYIIEWGDSKDIFLLTQYAVNGWKTGTPPSEITQLIRDGLVSWEVINDRLHVNGQSFFLPNGWSTQGTGRNDTYEKALQIFK